MADLIPIIVFLPLVIFLILAFWGSRLSTTVIAVLAVSGTFISTILTLALGWSFLSSPPEGFYLKADLWEWMSAAGLSVAISFHLDTLSLIFIFVVTFVGFLILLYSTEFMQGDEGYARFFAYINLFIASMLILVLADNLLLMYLGWEGVGLCSYLLIGFWYQDPANGYAARKAFIMTRIGDTALIIGLFLLFMEFDTLNIAEILAAAPAKWVQGNPTATLAAFLLLGGAIGKSAQLPLQTWLPDAMAGPSPVSALIHAATMVTAGVYLIARTHTIFELAPMAQHAVAIIGTATLLLAGFSALAQKDIKRVLAYSTMSQIGYMFLALGVGAWSAAIFHFMIHAFFKALLFLGAGAVILVVHHEHNMFKMGGLYKKLPVVFWTFLVASASLAALPLISAGFYSKDLILWEVFASESGGTTLWLLAFAGAFITALYTARMVLVTFFGKTGIEPTSRPGPRIAIPLVILAVLSFASGFIELPHSMGHLQLFSGVIHHTLPPVALRELSASSELILQVMTGIFCLVAIALAFLIYRTHNQQPATSNRNTALVNNFKKTGLGSWLHRFWNGGWGFDSVYQALLVNPLVALSRINKNDVIDLISIGLSEVLTRTNRVMVTTQNGRIRWYMTVIVIGAILTITISILI